MPNKLKLSEKRCLPCETGIAPFGMTEIKRYLPKLKKGWEAVENKKLRKLFKFKNFVETMGFVNQVALIAQAEDHHPDLQVSFSKVVLELWTHAAKGITENDFVLAAKIDEL
jgi:4a-hydroxytetrahydrobiopterin dehydratase